MKALILLSQGVGNVVMATPMIQGVHERGYDVDVFCNARCDAASLLQGWSAVNRVFNGWRTFEQYDVVIRGVWSSVPWPPAAIPARDYLSPDVLDLRQFHETYANWTVLRKLGYAGDMPMPHVETDEPGVELPSAFIALCPGYGSQRSAAWDRKLWPHWALLPDLGLPLVAVGAESDRELPMPGLALDLRGKLPLRRSAGVLARATAVVAIDNGLAHIAAALGTPTVAIFTFTSPIKNEPIGQKVKVVTAGLKCQPCQLTPAEKECTSRSCSESVTPQQVAEAVKCLIS